MNTITISDLRQRWPKVEALLQVEERVLVTRRGRPVAKWLCVAKREANCLHQNFKSITRFFR